MYSKVVVVETLHVVGLVETLYLVVVETLHVVVVVVEHYI